MLQWRPRHVWPLAALLVVGAAILLWVHYIAPSLAHIRWYHRVDEDLRTLYDRRPQEVAPGQWEFAVGWTINLHGNCGPTRTNVEPAWRDEFAAELERRLSGRLSLADIEWMWDEYEAHTKLGRKYSDSWRPTRAEGFADMRSGCFGHFVK